MALGEICYLCSIHISLQFVANSLKEKNKEWEVAEGLSEDVTFELRHKS